MEKFLLLGTILKIKGKDGTLIVRDVLEWADDLSEGMSLRLGYSLQFGKNYSVESWKRIGKDAELKLKEIKSPEIARKLRDCAVFIPESSFSPSKNEDWTIGEILGSVVKNIDTGEIIGTVKDVLLLPANDVWIVKTPDGDLPIPLTDNVVKEVNIRDKIISIKLIEGLLDLVKKKI